MPQQVHDDDRGVGSAALVVDARRPVSSVDGELPWEWFADERRWSLVAGVVGGRVPPEAYGDLPPDVPDDADAEVGAFELGEPWELSEAFALPRRGRVPWGCDPDDPVDVSGLEGMPPGPGLAAVLSGIHPGDVGTGDLVEVVKACHRLASWADAVQAAAMGELSRRPEYGVDPRDPRRDEAEELRLAGSEVAAGLWLSPATATNRVAVARVLAEQLPATLGALRSGEIDWRRAAAVAEVAFSHGREVAQQVEARVLPKAGRRTPAQHRQAIRRAILAVDPASAEQRHERAAEERRVCFYPGEDGMGQVVADLTGDGLAVLRAALDAAAAGLKSSCPGETRSMGQLRADALVHLARLSLRTGWLAGVTDPAAGGIRLASQQGRRPLIQVTVPYSTLIGVDDQPGELQGYGPIPASVARRIAGDGVWRRLLTDPATGALLDYGTTRYEPPPDLREHIIARDQTCVMPVCSQPAHRCQLDHTIPHPGGADQPVEPRTAAPVPPRRQNPRPLETGTAATGTVCVDQPRGQDLRPRTRPNRTHHRPPTRRR